MIEVAEAAEVAWMDSLDDWRNLNAFHPLMVIRIHGKVRESRLDDWRDFITVRLLLGSQFGGDDILVKAGFTGF